MKNAITKLKTMTCLLFLLIVTSVAKADTIKIYDDGFSVWVQGSPTSTQLPSNTPFFSAVFGTFSGGVFSTFGAIGASNSGYVDLSSPELISGTQLNDNTLLAVNAPIYLAIYNAPLVSGLASSYSSSYDRAILTDPNWKVTSAITFCSVPEWNLAFTSSTTAAVGSFSYNSGSEIITLVPEPSTGALMMIGTVGLVALRRLRKV